MGIQGCSQSLDTVPLREGGLSRSTGYTVAPSPALSNADPELFAPRHSGRAPSELAARPPEQPSGAAFFSRRRLTSLWLRSDLVAELSPSNPFDFFLEPGVEDYPFKYAAELTKDLEPYLSVSIGPGLYCQTFLGKPPRETREERSASWWI